VEDIAKQKISLASAVSDPIKRYLADKNWAKWKDSRIPAYSGRSGPVIPLEAGRDSV
jgi:hypothetical protein